MNRLACVLHDLRRFKEAEGLFRQMVSCAAWPLQRLFEGCLEAKVMVEADLLTCDNNLACALQDLGLLEEAVMLHRRVFVNSRKVKGKRHPAAWALETGSGFWP